MWLDGGTSCGVDVVGWRYKLRCGCSQAEVIGVAWEWLFAIIRRSVDVIDVRY